jgi:hypothetical protein
MLSMVGYSQCDWAQWRELLVIDMDVYAFRDHQTFSLKAIDARLSDYFGAVNHSALGVVARICSIIAINCIILFTSIGVARIAGATEPSGGRRA